MEAQLGDCNEMLLQERASEGSQSARRPRRAPSNAVRPAATSSTVARAGADVSVGTVGGAGSPVARGSPVPVVGGGWSVVSAGGRVRIPGRSDARADRSAGRLGPDGWVGGPSGVVEAAVAGGVGPPRALPPGGEPAVEGLEADGRVVDGPDVDGLVVDGPDVDGLVVEGLVVDGLVVDGPVEGLVVDGLVVGGLVVGGLVVGGLVVDGLVVGGLVVGGLVVDGLVVGGLVVGGLVVGGLLVTVVGEAAVVVVVESRGGFVLAMSRSPESAVAFASSRARPAAFVPSPVFAAEPSPQDVSAKARSAAP